MYIYIYINDKNSNPNFQTRTSFIIKNIYNVQFHL
jgi:hypothetical protein